MSNRIRPTPNKAKQEKRLSEKSRDLIEIGVIFAIVVLLILIVRYLMDHNFLISTKSKINYLLEQQQNTLEVAQNLKKTLDREPQSPKDTRAIIDNIIRDQENHIRTLLSIRSQF